MKSDRHTLCQYDVVLTLTVVIKQDLGTTPTEIMAVAAMHDQLDDVYEGMDGRRFCIGWKNNRPRNVLFRWIVCRTIRVNGWLSPTRPQLEALASPQA